MKNKLTIWNFDLNDLSRYRTQLMGISALGIIICHAAGNNVDMPSWLNFIVGFGNMGVDIFLLLSGLGLYYSLVSLYSDNGSIRVWYKKRFVRILVPYLLLSVPYWTFVCIHNGESVGQFFVHLSTLGFWLYHEGAWFVAFIIPLYILMPLFFKVSNYRGLGVWILVAMFVASVITSNIPMDEPDADDVSMTVVLNIQYCITRLPAFILGIIAAPLAMKKVSLPWYWWPILIVLPLIFIWGLNHFIVLKWHWLLMVSLLSASMLVLKICEWAEQKFHIKVNNFFLFWGVISLESYLANIYLGDALKNYFFNTHFTEYNVGNYLMYSCVIIFGLILSVLANKLTPHITKRLRR